MVEDDDLSIITMKRIFRKEFEISTCDSAEGFYEKFFDKNFDVIIMDISLKGELDGLELMKEIRASKLHNSTPLICLTAHSGSDMQHNAMEAGCDIFLTKPVSNTKFKDAVITLVKS